MSKIDLLNDASFEDLQRLDDVCSICYQAMTSAKMTKCNHYFHSVRAFLRRFNRQNKLQY